MKIIQTISKTEGPKNSKEAFALFLKGFLMGGADIIPGVSGGTMALITGIYEKLLNAISSINLIVLKNLFQGQITKAISQTHLKFLLVLLAGIGTAILTFSKLITYLLATFPIYCRSLFLGMILISALVLLKGMKNWPKNFLFFAGGLALAYFIVGMIPVETPQNSLFLFLSGIVAISAMILPGLSGAFILLILGKYEYILNLVHHPTNINNLVQILIFCLGCLIGILSFSRVLRYFLKNHYLATLACLSGLMLGALRKIWPWKEVLETAQIGKKVVIIAERNMLPNELNTQNLIAFGFILIGILFVAFLDRISSNK